MYDKIEGVEESIRVAKHYADGVERSGVVNPIAYAKLNLEVIKYAERARAQLHLVRESLSAAGLRNKTLPWFEGLAQEAEGLSVKARQNVLNLLPVDE
jgi:hypothetical protein